MKKILTLAVTATLTLGLMHGAQAATYVVNITDSNYSDFRDSTDTVLTSADPDETDSKMTCSDGGSGSNQCSLRKAITQAAALSENVSITLPSGTITLTQAGDDSNSDVGDLDIDTAASTATQITITGQGMATTVIDCNSSTTSDRCFDIVDEHITFSLNSLTVQNGVRSSSNGGGAIQMQFGSMAISQVKFSANTATNDGGAIAINLASGTQSLTIDDSWFDSNTVTGGSANGGAIYITGELAVTVTDSLFTSNTATNEGGALEFFNHTGASTIKNSTFYHNSASAGGAVSAAASNGGSAVAVNLAIKFSTFVSNTATVRGAGISARGGGDDTAAITSMANIFYGNTTASVTDNCATDFGTITSGTYNIESSTSDCGFTSTGDQRSTNPGLSSLASNGGSTQTMAFSAPSDSPALNIIDATTCATLWGSSTPLDQRGSNRTGYCDIGAYEYLDDVAPIITVTGDSTSSLECTATYADAGATSTDSIDGPLSVVTDTSSVNSTVLGNYTVNYSSTDQSLNTADATRTVSVIDTTDPDITLNGDSATTITAGTTYDDPSATGVDDCDAAVDVSITGDLDTDVAGVYTLTYTAQDNSNNTSTATRTITVEYGDIVSVERVDNTVVVHYTNEITDSFEPFGSSKKFYVTLLSEADHTFLVSNGKVARLYQDTNLLDSIALANNKPNKRRYFKMKTAEFYDGYTTGTVTIAGKTSAKVYVFRVKDDNTLTKKVSKSFTIMNRKQQVKIKTNASKHRITAKVGQSPVTAASYRLTTRGKLHAL